MSLLERVRECHRWDPAAYLPFRVAGRRMGWIDRRFARELKRWPAVFEVREDQIVLAERLDGFDNRTEAVHEVVLELWGEGQLPYWRDEFYPVLRRWDETPLFKLERGAAGLLGLRSFAVVLNGYVLREDGLWLWVATRSEDKQTEPGKFDNMVAGGQPHGIGILENLVKECREEAGLPEALARQARPSGTVAFCCERPDGLKDEVYFLFELALPEDFDPRNDDGEVSDFALWPVGQIRDSLAAGTSFDFSAALSFIHFMVGRGIIGPEDPDYQEICEGFAQSAAD